MRFELTEEEVGWIITWIDAIIAEIREKYNSKINKNEKANMQSILEKIKRYAPAQIIDDYDLDNLLSDLEALK